MVVQTDDYEITIDTDFVTVGRMQTCIRKANEAASSIVQAVDPEFHPAIVGVSILDDGRVDLVVRLYDS
jgi:hypothetical protein